MCYYMQRGDNMSKKKGNVNTYKKPSKFWYGIFYVICKFISWFGFNLKIEKNEIKDKKGPYLLLANHESVIDFINLCAASKHRHHFVMSNSFYQSMGRIITPIISQVRAIPKQQFQTSFTDLKQMRRVINNNMPLVLYPAGLMSENGNSTPIPKGTAKAVKWFNVDVYVAITQGSYLTKPKWGKKYRRGKIKMSITKLLDIEQINQMTEEEISTLLSNTLDFDSYENQEKNMIVHKGSENIKGLENVLYICPKCKQEFTMIYKDKKIRCSNCDNAASADKYGFLIQEKEGDVIYKHPSKWAKFIEQSIYDQIKNTDNYTLNCHGKLQMVNYKKHRFDYVGEASVTLNCDEFIMNATINGQEVEKHIPHHEMFLLPFTPGKCFELQDGNDIYRIVLDDGRVACKWMHTLKMFYKIRHEKKDEN